MSLPRIHNTAHVGVEAALGDGVEIGPFCYVDDTADIGDGVVLGAYCEVRAGCRIGARTRLGSRCTLSANVIIGEDCILKYGLVVTDTPNLDRTEKKPGSIGNGVRTGANVVVMPGVHIGDDCTIGACSQVRHDVPAGETWYGNPAKKIR